MKKLYKLVLSLLLISLVLPNLAFASWWNPFSWGIFSWVNKPVKNQTVNVATSTISIVKTTTTNKIKPKEEITDCSSIQDITEKNSCYFRLAVTKKDPYICNKISENINSGTKDACFSTFPEYIPYKLFSKKPLELTVSNSGKNFSLLITIRNENVLPFITNFGLYECTITGDTSKTHKYIARGFYKFTDKALLPGEEATVELKSEIDLPKTCLYNEKGIRVCEDPSSLITSIVSCDFSVSTDGSNTDGGWGKFFQTLVF